MKLRRVLVGLAASVLFACPSQAVTLDTHSVLPTDGFNAYPFGSTDITRYQSILPASFLGSAIGQTLQSVQVFFGGSYTTPYTLSIYATTITGGLSSNLNANAGPDRTLIYNGSLSLGTGLIDVNDLFVYQGGNLVLDYVISSQPAGVNLQSWMANGLGFGRAYSHNVYGVNLDSGGVEMALNFGAAAPEPPAFLLFMTLLPVLAPLARKRQ